MLDISKIRDQFPILKREVNGRDLVYFDNGSSTQKPQSVIDTITNYYKVENSNVHKGVHFLSGLATDKFEETRETIRQFIYLCYYLNYNLNIVLNTKFQCNYMKKIVFMGISNLKIF